VASIGIEVITEFSNYRKANGNVVIDLPGFKYFFYGFAKRLLDNNHKIEFFKPDTQCEEIHLKDTTFNGSDEKFAETVDLFFIGTHGYNKGSNIRIAYDTKKDEWEGDSTYWRLGNKKLKWLLVWGCSTIDLNNPLGLWDVFENIHQICSAHQDIEVLTFTSKDPSTGKVTVYNNTYGPFGDDLAEMLTDGHTVAEAWLSGMNHSISYGYFPNIVVCAENKITWGNGSPIWPLTNLNNDHLLGEGFTVSNVSKANKYWLSWQWIEPVISALSRERTGTRIGGPTGGHR